MVMRSQAYMSIMDWLAIKNCNIEEIQNESLGPWKVRLNEAYSSFEKRKIVPKNGYYLVSNQV